MNISCIFPDKKLKEPYRSAVREYEKRLGRYCKCKFLSQQQLKQIPPLASLVYITSGYPQAATISSEEFAHYLERQGIEGRSDLYFLISEVPPKSENVTSLSHARLSSQTMAVLLSEQVYRAFRIIHNHSYHK